MKNGLHLFQWESVSVPQRHVKHIETFWAQQKTLLRIAATKLFSAFGAQVVILFCGKKCLLLCMICMRKECSKRTSVVKNFKAEPQEKCMFIFTHIYKKVQSYPEAGNILALTLVKLTSMQGAREEVLVLCLVSPSLTCPYLQDANALWSELNKECH